MPFGELCRHQYWPTMEFVRTDRVADTFAGSDLTLYWYLSGPTLWRTNSTLMQLTTFILRGPTLWRRNSPAGTPEYTISGDMCLAASGGNLLTVSGGAGLCRHAVSAGLCRRTVGLHCGLRCHRHSGVHDQRRELVDGQRENY